MSCNLTTLSNAYEEKRYGDVLDGCSEMMKNGEDSPEVYAVAAKALLFTIDDPGSEKNQNLFATTVSRAAMGIKSVEDACMLEDELMQAIYAWRATNLSEKLENVRAHPESDDVYHAYTRAPVQYFNYIFPVSGLLFGNMADPYVKGIVSQKSPEEVKALRRKYEEKRINPLPDERIKLLEIDVAEDIFERAKSFFEENNDAAKDFSLKVGELTRRFLMIAQLLLGSSIPKAGEESKSKISTQTILSSLIAKSQVLQYELNAVLHPDGKAISLTPTKESREKTIRELQSLYKQIQTLDPSFEIPPLPSAEPIVPSSGGCYVATAVYGSYDCPQVWTLRRFRDNCLAKTWHGRVFITMYYAISPTLVKWFGQTQWFKRIWKQKLDKMIARLNSEGVTDTPYQDKQW